MMTRLSLYLLAIAVLSCDRANTPSQDARPDSGVPASDSQDAAADRDAPPDVQRDSPVPSPEGSQDAAEGVADVASGPPDAAGDLADTAPPENTLAKEWPAIAIGFESRGLSSFDRAGGNDDGFTGRYSTLYRLPSGEHVIVDVIGPGRLNNFWFTSGDSGHAPLDLGKIRIYLDDNVQPRSAIDANVLFSGNAPGFPHDLVFDNRRSTGGFVSWVRIPFERRLRITTDKEPFFYNAQYETFPVDAPPESWRPDVDDREWRGTFASSLASWDETDQSGTLTEVPLDHGHEGSGTIEAIVFAPKRPPLSAELRAARMQITWDEQLSPAVDVPLGTFFGTGLGETRVRSLAFRMDPGRYQNRFPMPYWKGFRLRVTGLDGRLWLRLGGPRFARGKAGHFHGVFREARPTSQTDDFEYLSFVGTGKLVGTVLTVEPIRPAVDKGWWEGDLRNYTDDRRTPSIHGTGHEDDHFGGWSNEFLDAPFTLPMHGEPRTEIFDRTGQFNGNATMYRLWPGIPFLRSIAHSVEHGHDNSRVVNYASSTFFYATAGSRLTDADRLSACDANARRDRRYTVEDESPPVTLTSAFEGRHSRSPVQACHVAHRGPAKFVMRVPAENTGVYLRRMFDQRQARQGAKISVDGQLVGTWYTVEGNETLRWAERDFFLPSKFTAGKTSIAIEVAPLTDGPPWNVSEYRLLAVGNSPP
jgi:hypothetical protein